MKINIVSQKIAYIKDVVQLYGSWSALENLDFFNGLAYTKTFATATQGHEYKH